jgi:hypothetical protein
VVIYKRSTPCYLVVEKQHEQRFSVLRYGPLKVEKMDPGAWDAHSILIDFCCSTHRLHSTLRHSPLFTSMNTLHQSPNSAESIISVQSVLLPGSCFVEGIWRLHRGTTL